jgi:DUF4097 and DUF4098 domain-containing protein YvlB
VVAEFQDVIITVKPIEAVKVRVVQEATDFAAKSKLADFLPTFVQMGGNDFIFVNHIKERLEPEQLEKKELPAFTISMGLPSIYGSVSIEMPPGMNVSVITYSGKCVLKGDLGEAKVRFQTNTGRIDIKGAMQDLETQTSYGPVGVELTREIRSAEVNIDRGKLEFDGGAIAMTINSQSANMTVTLLHKWSGTGTIETGSGAIQLRDVAGSPEPDSNHVSIHGDSNGPKFVIKTRTGNVFLKKRMR